MAKRRNPKSLLSRTEQQKEIDSDFGSGTTCHGFWRSTGATKGLQKMFWAVVIMAGFGLTCWQISLQIISYYSYSTTTQIIVNEYNNLSFPAVTICNYNKYRQSMLSHRERYAVEVGDSLYTDVEDTAHVKNDDIKTYLYNMSRLFPSGFDIEKVSRKAGWKLDNYTLLQCRFNSIPCSVNDFWHIFTEYGSCYMFNKNQKFIQYQSGAGNGLQLLLNINQSEYTDTLLWSSNIESGIRFHVHPANYAPEVLSKGQSLLPGYKTYAAFGTNKLVNAKKPWGDCNPKLKLKHFPEYTKSGCILECKDNLVSKKCNCKILHYPGSYPVCNPKQTAECARPLLINIRKNITSVCNHCLHGCSEVVHNVQMSYSAIPNKPISKAIADYIGMNASEIRENVVMVDLYYDFLKVFVTKINPAMTIDGLLSNIGGQLGLFLGLSIATLLEFLEFGIIRLLSFCYKDASYRKQPTDPPKTEHEMMPIYHTYPRENEEDLAGHVHPSPRMSLKDGSRRNSRALVDMLKQGVPDS